MSVGTIAIVIVVSVIVSLITQWAIDKVTGKNKW